MPAKSTASSVVGVLSAKESRNQRFLIMIGSFFDIKNYYISDIKIIIVIKFSIK
jgi:hypothetical protein